LLIWSYLQAKNNLKKQLYCVSSTAPNKNEQSFFKNN